MSEGFEREVLKHLFKADRMVFFMEGCDEISQSFKSFNRHLMMEKGLTGRFGNATYGLRLLKKRLKEENLKECYNATKYNTLSNQIYTLYSEFFLWTQEL